MSISERIKLLLRSEFNALKSSSNKEIRRAVLDLESEFSTLRVEEEKLIGSIRQRREEADMWEQRATLALKRDNDALAKSALSEQSRVLGEIKRLKEDLHQIQSYLQDIGTGIRRLRRSESLDAESSVTDPPSTTHSARPHKQPMPHGYTASGLQTSSESFQAFERVAASMEQKEASLQAEAELYSGFSSFSPNPDPILDPEGVAFEQEYRRIEREKKLNDDLKDLKSKFES